MGAIPIRSVSTSSGSRSSIPVTIGASWTSGTNDETCSPDYRGRGPRRRRGLRTGGRRGPSWHGRETVRGPKLQRAYPRYRRSDHKEPANPAKPLVCLTRLTTHSSPYSLHDRRRFRLDHRTSRSVVQNESTASSRAEFGSPVASTAAVASGSRPDSSTSVSRTPRWPTRYSGSSAEGSATYSARVSRQRSRWSSIWSSRIRSNRACENPPFE